MSNQNLCQARQWVGKGWFPGILGSILIGLPLGLWYLGQEPFELLAQIFCLLFWMGVGFLMGAGWFFLVAGWFMLLHIVGQVSDSVRYGNR